MPLHFPTTSLIMSLRGGLLLFPTKQSPLIRRLHRLCTKTHRSDMFTMSIAGLPSSSAKTIYALSIISLLLFGCSQSTQATSAPQNSPQPVFEFTSTPASNRLNKDDNTLFLSIEENGYAHLFTRSDQVQNLPLTRITAGEWNDIAPALSPDRRGLAFASDRNGFGIYTLWICKRGRLRSPTSPI